MYGIGMAGFFLTTLEEVLNNNKREIGEL